MEELERNVQRKDIVGFCHDMLQFHKLLASSDHYMLVFSLEKNVPWKKLSEKDFLDMMDLYVLHLKTASIDKENWKRTTVKSGESLVKTLVKSEVSPMNVPVKSEVSIPKTPVKIEGSERASSEALSTSFTKMSLADDSTKGDSSYSKKSLKLLEDL